MAESVDAPDLKSVDHCGRGSSSLPTRTKYLKRGIMKNTFEVSSSLVWYNDDRMVVKMYFLNDIPFTFDELPVGHLWDQDLVKEANGNKSFEIEDVYIEVLIILSWKDAILALITSRFQTPKYYQMIWFLTLMRKI